MGYESKVVLLGPVESDDPNDVIRGNSRELTSSEWWRSLGLDGVIMVAWGLDKDTPVVRAIAESGTPIVLHIDGSNVHYPFFEWIATFKTMWRGEHDMPYGFARKGASFLVRLAKATIFSLFKHSYLKYRQLRYLSLLSCQTPTSAKGNSGLCIRFGGNDHGVKILTNGYPIPESYKWDGSVEKEKIIIAIGRWDDLRQKRPFVLMSVCEAIARKHPDLKIHIFGKKIEAFDHWLARLETDVREQIIVHGFQPGEKMAEVLQRSQISFFPSSSEGGPQALFEGLSCGATTVALDSPHLPGARWAAEQGHAELAGSDTTESYVAALDRALQKWERGDVDAQQVSDFWRSKTQLNLLLERMMSAVAEGRVPQESR